MAKLKIVDQARAATLYQDLLDGMKGKTEVTVGHNTKLVRTSDFCIALRLYYTDVVRVYHDNSVVYNPDVYLTVTTIERINHIAKKLGYVASRAGGQFTLHKIRTTEAEEGESVVEETELDKMLADVAEYAYPSVILCHKEFVGENGEDCDDGLYLYVYGDGGWVIDSPSYLQDHRNIVAVADVHHYSGVHALEQELQQSIVIWD